MLLGENMATPSESSSQQQPPTYQRFDINSALSNLRTPHCDARRVKWLRRTLVHCLSADYNIVGKSKKPLSRKDWLALLQLSYDIRYLHWLIQLEQTPTFRPKPEVDPVTGRNKLQQQIFDLGQKIDSWIVDPADALDIPPDVAVGMVERYRYSVSRSHGHIPLWHRYRRCGAQVLASRLIIDRDIIFDMLVPSAGDPDVVKFRKLLDEKNKDVIDAHFSSLESPQRFVLTPRAQEKEDSYARNGENRQHGHLYWGTPPGPLFSLMKRCFAALPEEGEGKKKPGFFERWVRRKAELYLGRSD